MRQWLFIKNSRKHLPTHLLLLHQFGIGTIVHDAGAKDRGGEWAVDFLGIGVF